MKIWKYNAYLFIPLPENYSFLTLTNILTPALSEVLNSTDSDITALNIDDEQLIEWGETLNAMWIDAAHIRHHAGGWSYTKKTQNFKTVDGTTLNGALSAGATTITLTSASNFDNSGRIAIETANNAVDFIDYSNKSSNDLTVSTTTGAETVGMAHSTGEEVEKLYALPSDYAKTYKLYVNDVLYLPLRDATLFPYFRRYTQYGSYILFPQDIGAQDITHYYYKSPKTITALADETEIPTKFQRWAIEMSKHHIFRIRRQRADAQTSLVLAEIELEKALEYDKKMTSQNASFGLRTGFVR